MNIGDQVWDVTVQAFGTVKGTAPDGLVRVDYRGGLVDDIAAEHLHLVPPTHSFITLGDYGYVTVLRYDADAVIIGVVTPGPAIPQLKRFDQLTLFPRAFFKLLSVPAVPAVVSSTPLCCHRCKEPNHYDAPANRGENFLCGLCRGWEAYA